MNFFPGKDLPEYMYGAKMTPTGDGRGLLMTYEKSIQSFLCKSQTNCYWAKEEIELEISRRYHVMLTVPASLVDNCDCKLNSNGTCKCPIGVIGDACDQCKQGYWGLHQNSSLACKSKCFEIFKQLIIGDY